MMLGMVGTGMAETAMVGPGMGRGVRSYLGSRFQGKGGDFDPPPPVTFF